MVSQSFENKKLAKIMHPHLVRCAYVIILSLFITYILLLNNLVCRNYGGPRKEFFRLVLRAIKEKFFDNGLKNHLAEDYVIVGTIMG